MGFIKARRNLMTCNVQKSDSRAQMPGFSYGKIHHVKRGGYLQRYTPLKTKKRIKVVGSSETADLKQEIQDLVREIVIIRDGGCILRNYPGHVCSGFANDGHLILQADHLITRGNSATYADTRLIVCVCKGLHGWKKWNEKEYDAIIRTVISPERVALWDRCHAARYTPTRTGAYDWKMAIAALKQELRALQ
jgi:hypothetical protein